MHALIMSGGGALGAYEAGAAAVLMEHYDGTDDPIRLVSGTSVGALNALGLAQEGPDWLVDLWRKIRQGDVFKGPGFLKLRAVYRILRGRSVYDTAPLRDLIWRIADQEKLKRSEVQILVHATELQRRRQVSFAQDEPDLCYGVLASASLPGAFPPVLRGGLVMVDGGVVANTPIRAALSAGATRLTIIYLDNELIHKRISYREAARPGAQPVEDPGNAVDVLQRSLEAMMAGHLERDVSLLRARNEHVADAPEAAKRRGLVWVDHEILRPAKPLGPSGSTLNFDRGFLDRLIMEGASDAMRFVRSDGDVRA